MWLVDIRCGPPTPEPCTFHGLVLPSAPGTVQCMEQSAAWTGNVELYCLHLCSETKDIFIFGCQHVWELLKPRYINLHITLPALAQHMRVKTAGCDRVKITSSCEWSPELTCAWYFCLVWVTVVTVIVMRAGSTKQMSDPIVAPVMDNINSTVGTNHHTTHHMMSCTLTLQTNSPANSVNNTELALVLLRTVATDTCIRETFCHNVWRINTSIKSITIITKY